MHPTLILCLWFFVVLLTQRLPAPYLAGALVACLAGFGPAMRAHWWRLLRKSRWLLLVLALTFMWMTPGERVGGVLDGFPVTIEGVEAAAHHLLRLLAILFAVAWLVGGRSVAGLLAGFWGVAVLLGSAALKRSVIRLALTLRYLAEATPERQGSWRALLGDLRSAAAEPPGVSAADDSEDFLEIEAQAVPPLQLFCIGLAGLTTAGIWWVLG